MSLDEDTSSRESLPLLVMDDDIKLELSSDLSEIGPSIATHDKSDQPKSFLVGQVDKGFLAWSQVFAAHLIAFNTWGYNTSYGLFQAYYARNLDQTPSAISWVGSIQIFFTFFISTFSMHAIVAGPRYYYLVLVSGSVLQIIGVFTTAHCREYWQFFLAQGVLQGVGSGLFFAPTVGLISAYFEKKRSIANAGMASGMSTGGIIFPLIGRELLQTIGFEWTIRVMGLVIISNTALILILIRPPVVGRKRRATFIDFSAFTDLTFLAFAAGMVMAVLGMYFAYYYTTSFAEDKLSADTSMSLSLLLTLNAMGLPGRFVPAWIADRVLGPTNTLILVIFMSGIVTLSWALVTTLSELWVFVIFYGFFGASVQSLFPSSLGILSTDSSKYSIRVGMMFTILSIGCLCGPPTAGSLVQLGEGDYFIAQMSMGSVLVGGALTLLIPRLLHSRCRVIFNC